MFQALRIGRVFGIGLYVHPTFWLLPLIVVLTSWGTATARELGLELALLFAVFGCVALHELGHAVAAMLYGIRTRDITLYPIGGVARLENMPERPWPEIVVALAGPAVNVGIAALIVVMMVLDGVSPALPHGDSPVVSLWTQLLFANVILVLFNLIPAFPMDGGRVLRAALSWFTDRVTATEVASIIGGAFTALIAYVGLVHLNNFMLPVLAVLVFLMGRAEVAQVRAMAARREAERRWAGRVPLAFTDWGIPIARRADSSHPDGWEYDPMGRVWTEYRAGLPVRRVVLG